MNIDERIEKLTERHEALAQTVELLGHRIEAVSNNVDKLGIKVDAVVESIQDLVRVARIHEARILRLEEQS